MNNPLPELPNVIIEEIRSLLEASQGVSISVMKGIINIWFQSDLQDGNDIELYLTFIGFSVL